MNHPPTTEERIKVHPLREAQLPVKLRDWRAKLSTKAKQEKRFRFYSLYGMASHPDTLRGAWTQVRANGGSAGVDGVSIEQIEREGVEAFVEKLARELREKTYRAQAVRRVYIPKAGGKLRPLGIPTVRDRVVQTALMLILEPIFEADFMECSYGFRPGRNAHQALQAIHENLMAGRCTVYDADLEGYFDSIPHEQLMACVRMRVVDGSVLRLIQQWLNAPVETREEGGKRKRRRSDQGTPQGGVISPLLANIYLHWFDRVFHARNGPAHWAKAVLVRYADDFVVMARYTGPRLRGYIEEKIENWLGLKINREKTRVVDLRQPGTTLDFLGYSFRWDRDLLGREQRYWNVQPSKQALAREREAIRRLVHPGCCHQPLPELIRELNLQMKGWANYFRYGYSRKAFRAINCYVRVRLARHLRRRSQRKWRPPEGRSLYAHLEHLGLVRL